MRQKKTVLLILLSCGLVCLGQDPPSTTAAATVRLKVVKGLPFSATVLTESTQTLAGGNRIVRKTVALIARDSAGRTRREQTPVGTISSTILIQDPVAGVSYIVDTQSTSVRMTRVQTIEGVESSVNTVPTAASLGTEFIEGVLAEGTRLSQTIPADKVGSERSFEVISETWYSSQPQTIVRNRMVDPRFGVVDYRLTEIQLSEPAQSLFEIPKDYTIREEPATVRSFIVGKPKDK